MPRASKEATAATAAAIIRAGRALIAQRGYADVSLDEIAVAAGVTRGAVYHHYGSSKGLFAAVLREVQAEVAQAIDAATAGIDDPWTSLKLGSRAYLEASIAPATIRVLLVDGPAVVGWTQWRRGDVEHSARQLDDVMQQIAERGELAASAAAAAALFSGAMNEAALWIAEAEDHAAALDEAWSGLGIMIDALHRRPA